MRKTVGLVLAALALASCQTPSARNAGEPVETHEAMVAWINPPTLLIWDVTDSARSETEGLDPARMDDAAWLRLEGAARALEIGSRRMAKATTLRVGAHTAVEPGYAKKAEIQARLDQDPTWFRQSSANMAAQAQELGAAIKERNLRRTRDLAQNLGQACQTCHTRYWAKPNS